MLREERQAHLCLLNEKYAHSNAATHSQRIYSSVAILLRTMQGREHLREQLDSILIQTHTSWTIWASDHGSDDGTHTILDEYQARLEKSPYLYISGQQQASWQTFSR